MAIDRKISVSTIYTAELTLQPTTHHAITYLCTSSHKIVKKKVAMLQPRSSSHCMGVQFHFQKFCIHFTPGGQLTFMEVPRGNESASKMEDAKERCFAWPFSKLHSQVLQHPWIANLYAPLVFGST